VGIAVGRKKITPPRARVRVCVRVH